MAWLNGVLQVNKGFSTSKTVRGKPLGVVVLASVLCISLQSCSSALFSDLFVSYSEQMQASRYQIGSGQFQLAAKLIDEGRPSDNSYYLKLLEKGRISYLAGDYQQSQQYFKQVDEQLEWLSRQAEYRVSSGLQQLSTLATNDNFIRYHIPVYEQVMLHHYQAINYLHSQGLESALVEIRKAGLIQQQAMQETPISLEQQLRDYRQQYQELSQQLPQFKTQQQLANAYQNGLSYVLSAVLYLAAGQEDDAYIDYRKALALAPQNQYLQAEVARLGDKLAMEGYQQYTPLKGEALTKHQGLLVVIHEQSLVKARQEARFSLPLYHNNQWQNFTVALPVMRGQANIALPLDIQVAGQGLATEQVVQLDALAAKQLQQDLPRLLYRQILRLLSKEQLRRAVNQHNDTQHESWENVLVNLYNTASERADTRSWQSLPALAQIAIQALPAGQHTLKFEGLSQNLEPLNIRAGRVSLVLTNDLGSAIQVFNL